MSYPKGKRLSILGDSISTYIQASNDGSANSSTAANLFFYKEPFPLEKTYWMLVIKAFEMTLCVNNSQSGGNLSGRDDPTSGINRASQLSRDSGETPDLIILFMGMNDLGRRISREVFSADYKATLNIIKENYPRADVCCVNLPDRDIYLREAAIAFNHQIAEAVSEAGERFFIADLFGSRLNNDFYYMNTTDGLHPDEDGMKMIADVVEAAIRRKFNM